MHRRRSWLMAMIALLALTLDWLGGVLQRAATPRGIR